MRKLIGIWIGLACWISANAQVQELEQLKLDLEKLVQFKMMLSEMRSGYETLTKGYNSIREISKSDFNQHQQYLDALLSVSGSVRNNPAIKNIFNNNVLLVSNYKTLVSKLRSSAVFNLSELNELAQSFANISGIVNADAELLSTVLSNGKMRMSDGERASVIAVVDQSVRKQAAKMQLIADQYNKLMVLRLQAKRDMETLKRLTVK